MPSLRRSGLSSYIAFFVVLQVIGALELHLEQTSSSPAVPDGNVSVSWTSDSSDPPTFNIVLNCTPKATYNLSNSVPTSSQHINADMPSKINSQNSSLTCELQARNSDNNTLLFQVNIEVDNPAATNSTNTVSSQASIASTSSNTNLTPSMSGPSTFSTNTINTSSLSSLSSSSSSSSSFPSSSQAGISASQSSQSPSTCSSTCPDTTTTSSMLTSSSRSALPSAASLIQASKSPTGAIIGGVVGGVLGLVVLATLLLLCLRRSRRRHPSRFPSLMPDVKSKLSTVPFSANKAPLTAERGTPFEPLNASAAESQHNHSGSSSVGHDYFANQHIPDDTDASVLPMRFSGSLNNILVTVPAATPTMEEVEEDRKEQHTDHSSILTREPGPPDGARQLWNSSPRAMSYKEVNHSSSDVLNIREMDEETRKQRRDALLQQMQRVLDGEQSV